MRKFLYFLMTIFGLLIAPAAQACPEVGPLQHLVLPADRLGGADGLLAQYHVTLRELRAANRGAIRGRCVRWHVVGEQVESLDELLPGDEFVCDRYEHRLPIGRSITIPPTLARSEAARQCADGERGRLEVALAAAEARNRALTEQLQREEDLNRRLEQRLQKAEAKIASSSSAASVVPTVGIGALLFLAALGGMLALFRRYNRKQETTFSEPDPDAEAFHAECLAEAKQQQPPPPRPDRDLERRYGSGIAAGFLLLFLTVPSVAVAAEIDAACPIPTARSYTSVPGDMLRQPRGRGVLDRFGVTVQELDAANPGALRRVAVNGVRLWYLPPRTQLTIPLRRAEMQAALECQGRQAAALAALVSEVKADVATVNAPTNSPRKNNSGMALAAIGIVVGYVVGRRRRRTPLIVPQARDEALAGTPHWTWRRERPAFRFHPWKFDVGMLRCTCGETCDEREAAAHADGIHFRCLVCNKVFAEHVPYHECLIRAPERSRIEPALTFN